MSNEFVLDQSEFYRSLKQNISVGHAVLLGAGASVESGIQSATDCTWEWKRDIFIGNNPASTKYCKDFRNQSVQETVQNWLDQQGKFPSLNSSEEYSFYAENAYKIPRDRQRYFQNLINGKEPSFGYHILSILAKIGMVKSVWTTNFDGLMVKAAHINTMTPIEISIDTSQRLTEIFSSNELPCIALHGDYKFGPMKNTEQELDTQEEVFIDTLEQHVQSNNMVVLGYSGRDTSLMKALKKAFLKPSSGRLYWCGYGDEIPFPVKELIAELHNNGKEAFYIPTSGFDTTLLNIGLICSDKNQELATKLENLQKQIKLTDSPVVGFSVQKGELGGIAQSNLFPFSYPKSCFQFEIKKMENENWKDIFREIPTEQEIVFSHDGGNIIYVWGMFNDIHNAFAKRISSDITQIPLPNEFAETPPTFKNLIKKGITKSIASYLKMPCDNRGKIWDNKVSISIFAYGKKYKVFKAIKIGLSAVKNYSFFSLSPDFQLADRIKINKDIYKEISRQFYSKTISIRRRPNINYDQYINEWHKKIFQNNKRLNIEYPGSGSGFQFKFSANRLYSGINAKFNEYPLRKFPTGVSENQILYRGIVIDDPELSFYDSTSKSLINDFHPMRGLAQYQPYDYPINRSLNREEVDLAIICPQKYSNRLHRFLNELNANTKATSNQDYLIDYSGFRNVYGTNLTIPQPQTPMWRSFHIPHEFPNHRNCVDLANQITREMQIVNQNNPNAVIVIFIPKEMENFTSLYNETDSFNLHSFIKANAVQNNIATQLLREKTLDDNLKCPIMWWLSLALYVKTLRTPWILNSISQDTAFAGIGYGFAKNKEKNNIVLGCSHIYNACGQGLKYKLSPIDGTKCTWIKRNPFLTEQEAFKVGVSIRELFYTSSTEIPKRVVIHKRTPFTESEVKGFVNALKPHGVVNLDLLEICHENHVRFMAISPYNGNVDNYPVKRGYCFPINDRVAYLYTHGITSSVLGGNRKYFKGGTSIPVPIKIKKHYGDGDLTQIAFEILGLTKMDWNSFDLYSKLPCTIKSSSEIAKISWMLSHYEGRTYDYRYFM